ncbi:MAG: ComF family protein [Verrucomicrobiales bacterium]|nr:ComF family protein [Verrucomicrobiales bacterium]
MTLKFPDLPKTWLDAFLAFFYPPVCQLCLMNRATPAEGFVCETCVTGKNGVRYIEPPFCGKCGLPFEGAIEVAFECGNCKELELSFDSARSAVVANQLVLNVIHKYKYEGGLWFEPFLASLLIKKVQTSADVKEFDLVVPVPLYSARRREREFNQSERLGKRLAKELGLPLSTRGIERTRPTTTQTMLTRSERATNVRNAFTVKDKKLYSKKRVMLVDDVMTTGATTSACARAIRRAGAKSVHVWTVARGL